MTSVLYSPRILRRPFFRRSTHRVARELLGKYLVRKIRGKEIAVMITEVEIYDGIADKASNASRGKTARNEIMFGKPGHWYIYLCYGVHEMLNVVTREQGYPAAILIRGVEGVNGPGKLTKLLKITRTQNKKRAAPGSGLWIEDRGVRIPEKAIKKTPRIGVDYAGPYWAGKKWRFVIKKISP